MTTYENGAIETPEWQPEPRPWSCDFCRKPAVSMVGESNGTLVCDEHANPLRWAANQKCKGCDTCGDPVTIPANVELGDN